jgi:hypothetical protein
MQMTKKVEKAIICVCLLVFLAFAVWIIRKAILGGVSAIAPLDVVTVVAGWALLAISYLQLLRAKEADYESYVERKRLEWRRDVKKATEYLRRYQIESSIEEARDRYFKSNDSKFLFALLDDNRELEISLDEICRFFQDIQKDLVSFRRNDARMKELINLYFGKDIVYFYQKIGFFETVILQEWGERRATEEPYFRLLYEQIQGLQKDVESHVPKSDKRGF